MGTGAVTAVVPLWMKRSLASHCLISAGSVDLAMMALMLSIWLWVDIVFLFLLLLLLLLLLFLKESKKSRRRRRRRRRKRNTMSTQSQIDNINAIIARSTDPAEIKQCEAKLRFIQRGTTAVTAPVPMHSASAGKVDFYAYFSKPGPSF